MSLHKLKQELVKYGHLQICKEGVVFSVLITGKDLCNSNNVMEIQSAILGYAGNNFPVIEAMRNDDTFFCIILKPKS